MTYDYMTGTRMDQKHQLTWKGGLLAGVIGKYFLHIYIHTYVIWVSSLLRKENIPLGNGIVWQEGGQSTAGCRHGELRTKQKPNQFLVGSNVAMRKTLQASCVGRVCAQWATTTIQRQETRIRKTV